MELKSLYLHFPFCRHLCNYCDFHKVVLKDPAKIETFNDLLRESIATHQSFLEKNNYTMNNLTTFYMGGGTPSLWGESGAHFLKEIFDQFNITKSLNHEFTLEVNPGAWTDEGLDAFMDFGMNRFSLGVQSLDARFIKYLDRIHSIEEVHRTLEYFKANELNFSVDFMLGLPFSTKYKRDIIYELEEILKYNPDHLSLYILTTKDNYIHKEYLPDEDYIAKEYMDVANFLKAKGYEHYEVSNFAKKGRESKHNLKYWNSSGVGALGPSATGLLPEKRIRYKWKNQSNEMMIENLSIGDMQLEKIYMILRTNQGVNLSSNDEYFCNIKTASPEWIEKGFGLIKNNIFYTSSLGFLMVDSMMNDLFILEKNNNNKTNKKN